MVEPSDAELRERYRPSLAAEPQDLRAASGSTTADRKPVALVQQTVGRLNRMEAMQQQAMSAAQEIHRRARLSAVKAALRRLDDGDFGWCADCDEFIGTERLDLDPTLTRCVGCVR